jgi:cytochrome c oxidase subunit 4
MDAVHTEEIKKHIRTYIMVFIALMALTIVTVAISYLQLDTTTAILVALFVATVKGTLVGSYFMHLISEKKLIYWTLMLTAVFFIGLMVLPILTTSDHVLYHTK